MKKKTARKTAKRTAAKKKTAKRASARKTPRTSASRSRARLWQAAIGEIRISTVGGSHLLEKTEKMLAPRGGAVLWRIHNDCVMPPHPHKVRIQFVVDPLQASCVKEKLVPAGQTRLIACHVRPNVPEGTYPYAVRVDGHVFDPELEVRGRLELLLEGERSRSHGAPPSRRRCRRGRRAGGNKNEEGSEEDQPPEDREGLGVDGRPVGNGRHRRGRPRASCLTSATPWLLSSRGGEVVWLLQNRCTNTRKIKRSSSRFDLLEPGSKEKPVPGGQMDQIVCYVKETVAYGVYKYNVHGGDKILDPELEVRGPLRRPERQASKAKGARAKGSRPRATLTW